MISNRILIFIVHNRGKRKYGGIKLGKRKWLWIGGGILLFVVLFIGGWQWLQPEARAEAMTKEEAQKLVQEKYSGKVISAVLENDQYTVDIERDTGTYKVEIDAKSGEVLSLKRIGKKAEKVEAEPEVDEPQKEVASNEVEIKQPNEQPKVERQPTPQTSSKKETPQTSTTDARPPAEKPKSEPAKVEEPPKTLTENEAIQIAKGQISGEVDGIELGSVNGIAYYFVEVESGDDQEATIQINAITGEVKSLTWDD